MASYYNYENSQFSMRMDNHSDVYEDSSEEDVSAESSHFPKEARQVKMVSVQRIPLKVLLLPTVYAPIPETQIQSPIFKIGMAMLRAITSIPSQVMPKMVEFGTSVMSTSLFELIALQNWSEVPSKETASITLQLKLWQRLSLRWQQTWSFFVLLPITLVKRQKEREQKWRPGSAMTVYPKGSSLVRCKASIVDSLRSPAGNPPPTSMMLISCPYSLPIFKHSLAKRTPFLKAEEPCMPEPQWK